MDTDSPPRQSDATVDPRRRVDGLRSLAPGAGVSLAGVGGALLGHHFVPSLGVLTWAVLLGAVAANSGVLPASTRPGLKFATKRLLRVGVVLLGFSLSLLAIGALGAPMIALVVVTLFTTLIATTWLGTKLRLGPARSLLIGTGFAICGASAIAAMEENAEADDDDVAVAIAMVTLCGTAAMVILPLLQEPLGLSAEQYGAWAGASVHEVGQVVAAASPAGAAAVAVAVVVKLTRVLLLAPVVAGVSVRRRLRARADGADISTSRPPIVPGFVLGFLGCVVIRSAGLVPDALLPVIEVLQTATLAAALFGMGTGVHLRSLARSSGRALALSILSTLLIAGVALTGVTFLL
ncbi:MAG: YeiH family protein [Nocardioides sp.]